MPTPPHGGEALARISMIAGRAQRILEGILITRGGPPPTPQQVRLFVRDALEAAESEAVEIEVWRAEQEFLLRPTTAPPSRP